MELNSTFQRRSEVLWEKALDGIQPELRELIDGAQSNKRAALEIILYEAEQKREVCIRKRWKIKKRNGDIIILRDVFEKIVQCVQKFKELGNAVAQISPEYASVPWGAVMILLQTGINDNTAFAAMVDGLEVSTSIIARCAILEGVYLPQATSATSHLRSSLVALYGAVLTFLGTCFKYFSTSTARRFFKALIDPAKEIEDAMKDIESKQTEVERTAQIMSMEILTTTSTRMVDLTFMVTSLAMQLEVANSKLMSLNAHSEAASVQRRASVNAAITTIMGPKQRMVKVTGEKDDLKVEERVVRHDWLSSVRYQPHHQTEAQGRMADSGQWLFQRSEFLIWTDSSISSTLWLHGPPGCGKTKLASAVIDFDRARAKSQTGIAAPVAYFYCNAGGSERTQPSEALRCIARQLCGDDPKLPVNEDLRHAYEAAGNPQIGQNKLSIEETMALILRTLSKNPATIVIDALDELCANDRYQLWDCLDTIVKDSPNIVKVFLTSRRDRDIVCRLSSTPNIYISVQDNRSDIERFTEQEVDNAVMRKKLLEGVVSDQLRWQIVHALNQGSQGMFRWVSLQIQNLCDNKRMKVEGDIRHELLQLPQSLSALYAISFDQMAQLPSPKYQVAVSALQLLLVVVRPIPWPEILHLLQVFHPAVAAGMTREQLLEITYNFIDDDGQSRHPRLAHQSVREYLRTRAEFAPGISNAKAAELCMHHIASQGNMHTRNFCYSTFYLGTHLSATGPEDRMPIQSWLTRLLLPLETLQQGPSELFRKWRRRLDSFIKAKLLSEVGADSANQCLETMVSVTPLASICAMGLVEMLPHFHPSQNELFHNAGIPNHDTFLTFEGVEAMGIYYGKSCLFIAVILGRHDIVGWAHDLGFSVDTPLESGETPLSFAAMRGDPDMIKTLLYHGADPNQTILKPYASTALLSLSETIHGTLEPFNRDPKSVMGFHVRNNYGRLEVQSPFLVMREAYTIVHLAMHTARGAECVELLLRSGANVNARTSRDMTALEYCLEYSNLEAMFEVFRTLIRWKVEVNAMLQNGRTIAHVIAAMGHTELMIQLLDAGADCALRDQFSQSPLDLARRYGHPKMADLLVSRRAVPLPTDPGDENGFPLLHRSSSLTEIGNTTRLNPSISIQNCDLSEQNAPSFLTSEEQTTPTFDDILKNSPGPRLDVAQISRRKTVSDSWRRIKSFSSLKHL